jgi:hypothetical protein
MGRKYDNEVSATNIASSLTSSTQEAENPKPGELNPSEMWVRKPLSRYSQRLLLRQTFRVGTLVKRVVQPCREDCKEQIQSIMCSFTERFRCRCYLEY